MAGFKMHVTVSSLCGCGYAAGGFLYGMPLETSLLGGALCGFSGMLPDLDSDYGTPLRETMAFTAATLPMLLLHRLHSLGLQHDEMALIGIAVYLFMRFGVTKMIRKYTVHRGMFHSIPAGLTFAGLAFIICGDSFDLHLRYFKAGGVLLGFMSHLILDEIYSVEWKSGAWRLKKSSGTALKLWGDDHWANFSTYAKLLVVAVIILGEPSVMEQIQKRNPELAQRQLELRSRFQSWSDRLVNRPVVQSAKSWNPFAYQSMQNAAPLTTRVQPAPFAASPQQPAPTNQQFINPFDQPPTQVPQPQGGNGFDTAQRPVWPVTQ